MRESSDGYRLFISAKASRKLKAITKLISKIDVVTALEEIEEDPQNAGKPLSEELTGRLSFHLKVYRIVYRINKQNKVVQVLDADHRSKIYL